MGTRSRTSKPGPSTFGGIFDFDAKARRLAEVERLSEDPTLWDDPKKAQDVGRERKALESVVLSLLANPLAAALGALAIAFYVVGYTMLLKRRTPQNIVWGGAAGCMPVLIAWAAVTGSLAWTPVVLFLIVFWWTPPHYWPLSLRYRDDYAAAGVPMLPVVADLGKVEAMPHLEGKRMFILIAPIKKK